MKHKIRIWIKGGRALDITNPRLIRFTGKHKLLLEFSEDKTKELKNITFIAIEMLK